MSRSVSPFSRLEAEAEILTTSALSRIAANSKEILVRVLGSTKKFTNVLPRSAGTFLRFLSPTPLKAVAVSRINFNSSAVWSARAQRSLCFQECGVVVMRRAVWRRGA